MFDLKALNNIKKPSLLKEEIIKSKIEDNYQVQLTDYIILQKKVNSIKNILIHKPGLSALDYTKLNKFFNFSKSIIMSKKLNKNDDSNYPMYKSSDKKRIKDKLDKKLYLSNPILKKIFLSNESEEEKMSQLNTDSNVSKRYPSAFNRYSNLNQNKKTNLKIKSNYIYRRPKDNLYKLPQQIKNKYSYNLTDLKNNTIKRNYQLKEKMSQFDKFAKYFIRGLSLSEEQNNLYQKCKHTDLSLDDNKRKKTRYVKMNVINDKFDKRLSLEVFKKRFIPKKKEKNINGALFKYSLRNLLKAENPIKILLE